MRIKSITVGGYKNLEKSKIEFGGIVALLAINNYGKSNLLEAIDFGMEFIQAAPKVRKAMMGHIKSIPLTPSLQESEYFFEVELFEPELKEYCHVKYGFSFAWYRDDQTGARITDEWLEARNSESVRYTGYLKRALSKYRKNKATQSFRSIPLDTNQLAIDLLPLIEDADVAKVASALRSMDYRICSTLELQSEFQSIPFEYVTEQPERGVAFDDADIPKALYKLREKHPDAYRLFEDAVFTLFPEFTKIALTSVNAVSPSEIHRVSFVLKDGEISQAEAEGMIPPVRLKEELYRMMVFSRYLNQPISIANMSAGTRRIIWMLANVFIAACAGINAIGIEEIETSIHPKLLKSLLEILSDAARNTCILLSSHSPYLIQYLKAESLYIGVPDESGAACFRRIKRTKIKQLVGISRELDMSVGEYLFDMLTKDRYASTLMQYLEVEPDEE